jgi:ubiquinone/menaquinone biosynthesis C-methylase UbiE
MSVPKSDSPDIAALKTRQQAAWASGDYGVVGTTLQIVGETLCEAIDLRSGERVLDVAAGNGNATLAAARRWAEVTSTDYVPALLDQGRRRAEAEGLKVAFETADAENLPFAEGSFDAVLSTFGVMFTADHAKAASELARVTRKGGRIAMANWTPEGFIGKMFGVIGKHVKPPPGAKPPPSWGARAYLDELFAGKGEIAAEKRIFVFRYRSPEHWLDVFRTWYGPTLKAFAGLPEEGQNAFARDLLDLVAGFNRARDGTMVVESEYLEAVVTRG